MNVRRLYSGVTLIILLAALLIPASAQEGSDVIADGLTNPRNLSYDSEGNLYVAEAGTGGDLITDADEEFGATGQITRIASDGSREVVVLGLMSYLTDNSRGVQDVQVTDESIWVLLGQLADFRIPYSHALVELDIETKRIKTWVDLLNIELEQDPDGNANQQSNPVDFEVAADGSVLIVDASCNCLIEWSADAGLSVVAAWPFEGDNPVPTGVDIGPDGDVYISFLTGFPFPEGEARIERWSGGELAQTYDGLTALTAILVTDDGTIYASEYGVFDMGAGWGPGRVVTVSDEGITPVLENLTQPYGLAQTPDGTIVVATGAATGEGAGSVVALPGS